ncbi:MAG: iron chelate uptake ABC transporter family permease subunit [Polaromonas sp.]|nr:iron chelate uptake ABC transporter family permease subunit [Polaromonas sp.]
MTQPRLLAAPSARLGLLAALALACIAAFMTIGANGQWDFVLPFRGLKLAALLLVAYAIAVSTVLFQTITHNRILTPSIMGFDALYVLIQTALVFTLGLERTNLIDVRLKFGFEVLLMVSLAWLLFRWLFSGAVRSLHLMMLVGIVFGILFRSLTSFMVRVIDPNEFLVLQDRLFASFNTVQQQLLFVATVTVLAVSVAAWRIAHTFDVIALGRELAINLGLNYQKLVMRLLVLIAILVSVATALVGPVTFFGLLVANLAYQIMGSDKHRLVLPAAVLLGCIFLVGGQVILERVFSFNSALSVVVEFLGGLMFIALLLRKVSR